MTTRLAALLAAGLACPAAAAPPTFADVQKVFRRHCAACHNPDRAKGDLVLTKYSELLKDAKSGKPVVAGDPRRSLIYTLPAHIEKPFMPPGGKTIPTKDLALIKRWIEAGIPDKAAARPKPAAAVSRGGLMPADWPAVPVFASKRSNAVTALAASPAAPLVAVAGQGQVLAFHAGTLKRVGVLPFPEGDVCSLSFSPDGRRLLAAGGNPGESGTAVLFDVATGRRLAMAGDEVDTVLTAGVTDGLLALAGPNRSVKVFGRDGRPRYRLRAHTDWVLTAAFSPEGLLLATGDRDGGLFVWEAATGKKFWELRGHKGAVTGVAWRTDSEALVSVSEDGTARTWDMHTGEPLARWGADAAGVLGVAVGPGDLIATCGRGKTAKTWSFAGETRRTFGPLPDQVTRVAIDHRGRRLIAGDWRGNVLAYSLIDGRRVGRLKVNPGRAEPDERAVSAAELAAAERAAAEAEAAAGPAREALSAARDSAAAARRAADAAEKVLRFAERRAAEREAGARAARRRLEELRRRAGGR